MSTKKYVLNVGNIGNIEYSRKTVAMKDYNHYVELSKGSSGRAYNEPVTLFENDLIIKEYLPENEEENEY